MNRFDHAIALASSQVMSITELVDAMSAGAAFAKSIEAQRVLPTPKM